MRQTLWTLAVCALLTAASAQITYQEQGDAGDLPETAQATGTDTNTALGAIRGALEADGVETIPSTLCAVPTVPKADCNRASTTEQAVFSSAASTCWR